ncbi:MAG: MqnA/MqnD/SBP family protein [Planctomycetota bacterium]
MTRALRIGISTCPNDTFAFHALLTGAVQAEGLELSFELLDVQELNERMLAGRFDAAKVSFHAALALAADTFVLPSGSALGHGVGPLLLAAAPDRTPAPAALVLCPGRWTTATLLYRLFHPDGGRIEHRVFSDIFPALQGAEVDLGVCIHEGRFTWREAGLSYVEDLGERWEAETGLPLPLGGIVARRDLGAEALESLQEAIHASLSWALAHREDCLPTLRRYAQELSDDVLWAHVDLYVNERTLDLGREGGVALAALADLARARGLLAPGADLELLGRGASRLFHLLPWSAWDELGPAPGAEHRPESLAREGFVHLSFADQLQGTLDAHFAGAPPLALLELHPARVGADLRLEPSRGGALFPHLYRPLRRADAARAWRLAPSSGRFELPDEV